MSRACAPRSDGASNDWSCARAASEKGPTVGRGHGSPSPASRAGKRLAAATGAEKVSTDLARRFDRIRIEDLDVRAMTRSAKGIAAQPGCNVRQKAGLNRAILANGWGALLEPAGGQGPRPGGKDLSRVHEPALLGVRARRSGEPRESSVPVRRLRAPGACGREPGTEHCRRACGDCVGGRAVGRAYEPRTDHARGRRLGRANPCSSRARRMSLDHQDAAAVLAALDGLGRQLAERGQLDRGDRHPAALAGVADQGGRPDPALALADLVVEGPQLPVDPGRDLVGGAPARWRGRRRSRPGRRRGPG